MCSGCFYYIQLQLQWHTSLSWICFFKKTIVTHENNFLELTETISLKLSSNTKAHSNKQCWTAGWNISATQARAVSTQYTQYAVLGHPPRSFVFLCPDTRSMSVPDGNTICGCDTITHTFAGLSYSAAGSLHIYSDKWPNIVNSTAVLLTCTSNVLAKG